MEELKNKIGNSQKETNHFKIIYGSSSTGKTEGIKKVLHNIMEETNNASNKKNVIYLSLRDSQKKKEMKNKL